MQEPLGFKYHSFTEPAAPDGTQVLSGDPDPWNTSACDTPNPPPWCEDATSIPLTGFDVMLCLSMLFGAAVIYFKKSCQKT